MHGEETGKARMEHDIYSERPRDLSAVNDIRDWSVAEGNPDPRGWGLHDRDDNKLGQIEDMIVNNENDQVIYLITGHGGLLGLGEEKKLIPLERVRLDRERERVMLDGTADDIKNAPEYKKDTREWNPFYDYWSGRRPKHEEHTGPRFHERQTPAEFEERPDVGRADKESRSVEARKEPQTGERSKRVIKTVEVPVEVTIVPQEPSHAEQLAEGEIEEEEEPHREPGRRI